MTPRTGTSASRIQFNPMDNDDSIDSYCGEFSPTKQHLNPFHFLGFYPGTKNESNKNMQAALKLLEEEEDRLRIEVEQELKNLQLKI